MSSHWANIRPTFFPFCNPGHGNLPASLGSPMAKRAIKVVKSGSWKSPWLKSWIGNSWALMLIHGHYFSLTWNLGHWIRLGSLWTVRAKRAIRVEKTMHYMWGPEASHVAGQGKVQQCLANHQICSAYRQTHLHTPSEPAIYPKKSNSYREHGKMGLKAHC